MRTTSSRLLASIRNAVRYIPAKIDIHGPGRKFLLHAVEPWVGTEGVTQANLGDIQLTLDLAIENERLMAVALPRMVRTYERTPLGVLLARVIEPGDVFIDIGANLGLYSLIAKSLGATPILFEPEPRYAGFLRRNADAFGEVREIALADRDGEEVFHVGNENKRGGSSLVGSQLGIYDSEIRVIVKRFDSLDLPSELVDRVRLCKIDVEGVEVAAVSGMGDFLAARRCPYVWCEVRGPKSPRAPGSYRDVSALMKRHGYSAHEARGDRLVPFNADESRMRGVFDMLFTPN